MFWLGRGWADEFAFGMQASSACRWGPVNVYCSLNSLEGVIGDSIGE